LQNRLWVSPRALASFGFDWLENNPFFFSPHISKNLFASRGPKKIMVGQSMIWADKWCLNYFARQWFPVPVRTIFSIMRV
jgi:hypothetical protein